MSRKYFGTDGVRGKVGEHPITPQFVMHLGYAAGKVLAKAEHSPGDRPAVLIGKDTRISGYMLESALEAGLIAAGIDVYLAGPVPTPAVAYLTRALRLQAGVVISASHNPFEDNGIKFFSGAGTKLPDDVEHAIEAALDEPMQTNASDALGKAKRIDDAVGRYIEFCKSTFPNEMDLRGMKIVVDCAHGATYHIARHVFHELGAEVVAIGAEPNGLNINDGYGATKPQNLQKAVVAHKADVGIALDGDGDRLVMVDAAGKLYDGDQLLYVIARQHHAEGTMKGGVVGTLMTNLAFEHAMQHLGIPFMRAKVGDRYVMEMLQQQGWQLGGENSGHIICLDKHSTGDGIVSALQVLHALRMKKQTLAEAAAELHMYPQVLINVKMAKKEDLSNHPKVKHAVETAEVMLDGKGRVLLRPSGTEPLLRVMVEGEDGAKVQLCAEKIAEAVKAAAA
ncbi:MAG: phosphoglucosamine mutase [Gammaproteobacteria bacterium]|nr:phosphoglucosamine mutase [Gammaproteobacteria bacterium]MBU1447448.1 phosphoglucosamine mutase [Gammaproteobacteria bacterium]MDD2928764.1 phosphoglucosamine mutase [Sideroxydans sp.]MDD5471366.1 phosphoglucosamine mutase [Sideroxydans sp.]